MHIRYPILTLYAVMLLLRAYVSLAHDAILYAAQASNWLEPAVWQNDIFFRFGSQDQFTVFSKIVGPVLSVLNVEVAFAVLYCLGHLLFVSGVWAVAQVLVNDRRWAFLGALMMGLVTVPFAGQGTFHIVEPYLTPRLVALPMGLWAMACGFQARYLRAAMCLVVAGAFHPLYIMGPFLCILGMWLWPRPRLLVATVIVAALGAAVVLGVPEIGSKVFGTMEDDWKCVARTCTSYNFITEWEPEDAVGILVAAMVHGLGLWLSPRLRGFCAACLAVMVIALVGSYLAEMLPYKLLFQGQPYRALWVPQFLALPVAVEVLRLTWQAKLVPSLAAVFAFLMVIASVHHDKYLGLALGAAGVGAFLTHHRQPRLGAIVGFAVAFSIARLPEFLPVAIASFDSTSEFSIIPPTARLFIASGYAGPVARLVVAGLLALLVSRFPLAIVPLMALGLGVVAVGSQTDYASQYANPNQKNTAFVIEHLRQARTSNKRPTVYWPFQDGGIVKTPWFGAGAEQFVSWTQSSGVLFNRGTALEAHRRMKLVMPLEVGNDKSETVTSDDLVQRLFDPRGHKTGGGQVRIPRATADDIRRLAQEPGLDWVVTRAHFPELTPSGNGSIFLYDLQKLRLGEKPIAKPE
jgi:hypothetical protein